MMSEDELFIRSFGLYELSDYIFAKQTRQKWEEDYQEMVETCYDEVPMTCTRYDYDAGRVVMGNGGGSVEDYVINMIERKETVLRTLNRIRQKEELFTLAMDTLTPEERDVINVQYFNHDNDLGLSLEFFTEVLAEAHKKLCTFIGNERQKQMELQELERKQEIREQLTHWKRKQV